MTDEDDKPKDTLTFTVSVGHGEYVLEHVENINAQGLVESARRDVTVEVLRGVIAGDLSDVWDESETAIEGSYVTVLGHDYDVQWEDFEQWFGPRELLEHWLIQLADEVFAGPHGADDDTFDYWPSGVRYCMQVADRLGESWPDWIAQKARAAIMTKRPEFAEELFNSIHLNA